MTETPNQIPLDQEALAATSDVDNRSAEWVTDEAVTMIDMRRHSEYADSFPEAGWGKATPEEEESLGHLTEVGVQNAHRVAQELVEKRIEQTAGNIDFLVVASPTHWLGDEKLGQRAIETAKIYSDEVLSALEQKRYPCRSSLEYKPQAIGPT